VPKGSLLLQIFF